MCFLNRMETRFKSLCMLRPSFLDQDLKEIGSMSLVSLHTRRHNFHFSMLATKIGTTFLFPIHLDSLLNLKSMHLNNNKKLVCLFFRMFFLFLRKYAFNFKF
uniref:Uncharacterized protein n=1 Tax=Cacopsylla melanoneura TaxID=428564 RepID=A0A8D8Z8X9_9HEMI